MRKIKFRAWDLYNKKMIILGDLETISLNKNLDFANYKVMQFTGLEGKKDVEIYEDDFIQHNDRIFHVRFSEDNCGFILECVNEKSQDGNTIFRSMEWLKNCSMYCKVLSNIHDNPESTE